MDPSLRMVFVAAVLMLALLTAIVSTVSVEPFSLERQSRTVEAGQSKLASPPQM